jgi:hypothetical protein
VRSPFPSLSLALVLPLGVGAPTSAHAATPAPEPDGDDDEQQEAAAPDDPEVEAPPSPEAHKATRQIVGGAVAGSFGFILSIVAFGLAGARATCEIEDDPKCARNMGIAALSTGIPGLALMATGGTLIGLGVKRRRALRASASTTATVSPWLGREGAGASFTLRF